MPFNSPFPLLPSVQMTLTYPYINSANLYSEMTRHVASRPKSCSPESPSSARLFASLVDGEPNAADDIFHRYLQRLTRLARTRLAPQLNARTAPEDIVMSAYRSFFVGAAAGRFRNDKAGDLWALLATIAMRKLYRTIAHHSAEKRAIDREQPIPESQNEGHWFRSNQPTPDEAVALSDELEWLLASQTPDHRRMLELRLQGFSMEEIAAEVGAAERTVRRVLQHVREQLASDSDVPTEFRVRSSIEVLPQPTVNADAENSASPYVRRDDETDFTHDFRELVLTRMIGAGGMGKVYQAQQVDHDEPVAVKFLRKSLQHDAASVQRFLQEARLIGELNHPHIVPLFGVGRTSGGIHFLVMRFVSGQNLASLIAAGELPVACIQGWVIQTAEALQHAHSQNIVHCDLKPANIVVDESGSAVVTDFGLAQSLSGPSVAVPAMAGTAAWMAPEQVDDYFGPVTEQTDVYGFGALLYSLLTGNPPFSGRTLPDVLANVVSGHGSFPGTARFRLPNCVQTLRRRSRSYASTVCNENLSGDRVRWERFWKNSEAYRDEHRVPLSVDAIMATLVPPVRKRRAVRSAGRAGRRACASGGAGRQGKDGVPDGTNGQRR